MEIKNTKILIIDDSIDNLIVLKALVTNAFESMEVILATNGFEGLSLAASDKPDVILLDIILPDLDGFEVCERLKSDDRISDIPVVFITAYKDDIKSRIRGYEVGGEAFLLRPFDTDELVTIIRAMLKRKYDNEHKRNESYKLNSKIQEQSIELNSTHKATLNLLEDLKAENEARRNSEVALQASEALYRSILNASPDNITVTDLSGKIKMISHNGLKLIGYKHEYEVVDRYIGEFLVFEDVERAVKNIEGMMTGVFNGPEEYRLVHADKTIVNVEINAEFVLDSEGKPYQMVFAIRDIRDRIKNQLALRESEEKYRTLVQYSSDPIFSYNPDFTYRFVNERFAKTFGYLPEEIIGKTPDFLFDAKESHKRIESVKKVIETGIKDELEVKIKNAQGDDMYLLTMLDPIKDMDGKVIYVSCISKDITERKKMEISLRQSEEKYRLITEKITDVVWLMDLSGKSMYVSQSIENFTGYTVEEYLNQSISDRFTPESAVLAIKMLKDEVERDNKKNVKNNDFKLIVQLDYKCKDGNIKSGELLITPYFEDNKLIGIHGVTRDISERKKNEAKLHQIRQNYETFFNTIDDFLFVMDEQGIIIHTNNTVLNRLEYQKDELIGMSVLKVHPPERREEAGRIVGEMLMGITESCPVPLITKSGFHIPVETRISRGFWDGKPVIFGVTKDITNLVFSEEKFSKLFHLNPSAAGLSDVNDGKYIEVNQAFYDLLGFTEKEVIGKTAFELGILDETNKKKLFGALDENGSVSNKEIDLIAKNGEIKNVSISGQSILVQNQMYRFTVVNDLTQQKKNQQALLQSEEKYRMLVENSPNGIAMYQDGKFVYINNTGLQLFGSDNAEQILGKPILSIVHPDSMEAVVKRVSMVSGGGSVPPLQEKLLRHDGSVFHAEVTALATTYNGKPAGQVIVNDITERKLAAEKLSESEEKYREMAEMLPQIIFETDKEGIITYINKQAYVKTGYDEINESVIGTNCFDFYIPEDKQRALDTVEMKKTGIAMSNNEYRMKKKDGSSFPVLINSTPIIKDSQYQGLRGIIIDITDQKFAEERIRQLARLHEFQSQINQTIVKSKNHKELFNSICDVAIKYGHFRMSWIGIYDGAKDKIIPFVSAGYNEGYLEDLTIAPGSKTNGRGPTGLAFHESRQVFCNDIENDQVMIPWKEAALKRGFQSSFSLPIFKKEKPFGTFTIYAAEKHFFGEEEKDVLSDLGKNISYAIDAIESESERQLNAQALTESESKYRSLMDNSPEGITIYVDGKVAYINNEALRLMRANDKNEMMGKSIVDFIHPDNRDLVFERMKLVAMAPINSVLPSVEEKYIRLDGTEVYVEIKVMPILFEGKPAVQLAGHDISNRKEAELALEQSRIELQTIYDNAPVMMCVVDEDRNIQFANNAFANLTGIAEDIMKGGSVGRVVGCVNSLDNVRGCGFGPNCSSCTIRMAMLKTFKTGIGQSNIEYQSIVTHDGNKRFVSLLASTAIINTGDSKRLLLCLVDITDRKMTEEALQKSETLLRTFIDNSPFEIWARDINSVGILENKKLTDHYGSIIGHSTTNDPRVNNDIVDLWERNNARVFKGEIIDEEYIFSIDGEPRIFQQIVFPIKNNEKVVGIAGFNIDITDRKNAEQKIVESNNRFELAAQIANMSWWEMNLKSSEVIFSKNKTDLLGYDASQFTTYSDFQKIVHPDDIENCNQTMINHILNKVEKYEIEFRMLTSTGEYRWFYDIGSISKHDLNGEPLNISGLSIDITERKKSIEALNESKEELAKFASHLQSVREEERSILARDIHDDLGQILIAMKIDLGLLKQNVMKNMNSAEYETLRIRFEELSKLVDNTLKSARRIMTDLRPEVLDLLGFVETVTQHLKSFEERTKISCIFSNNVENLNLNSKQSVALYRIVQEALNNTAKYSRATEVQLNLKEEGNYLSLVISDNGVGFDMNDPKRGDSYGLMGMKERAVLLEGKLEINSNMGTGTRIKVLLPYSNNT